MSELTFTQPKRARSGTRTVSVVIGALVGLFAAGLLTAGGAVLWADSQKDDTGYLTSAAHTFSANSRAIVTEDIDLDLDGLGSVDAGRIRLNVDSTSGEPVFVGIARSSDVSSYLRDVSHTTVTDVDYSPFEADYRDEQGTRRPSAPAQAGFWAATANGTGAQTLDWDVEDGTWSIVVMNADGSPGVRADVSAGAKVPFLAAIGWGLAGGGLLAALLATGLIVAGVRTPTAHRFQPGPQALTPSAG